jgi:hypothetical protein
MTIRDVQLVPNFDDVRNGSSEVRVNLAIWMFVTTLNYFPSFCMLVTNKTLRVYPNETKRCMDDRQLSYL